MKSPFKFLDPYELKDREAFFGREAEVRELYNLVTKNRLTFVYGPSGTGKTSLVQCGLAARFGGVDWLPIFVRRGDDLNAALRREIGKALGEETSGDLPEAITGLFNRYLRPVYLIFDQFEELFILGRPNEQQAFYDTIAELLDAELPCRLLFILREDYFGHLNQFEKTVPELYHRKLRVEPMSRDNLRAVIAGSCKVYHIGFDDARRSPEQIMDNIMADKSGVHMPYVQVYLHMLFQEMLVTREASDEKAPLHFSDAVIQKVGPITDVLGRFLQEQKTAIQKRLRDKGALSAFGLPDATAGTKSNKAAEEETDLVAQVLDVFVSGEGTKIPIAYARTEAGALALSGQVGQTLSILRPEIVSAILLELEAARILRRGDDSLELAHDTLAALIDQQRSAELRQLRDLRRRIETGMQEHEDSGGQYFFDKGQLARIEPFLPKLALNAAQLAFLDNSRVEAERLENAEKERAARELRLVEEKLAAEERARKRQRRITTLALMAAAIAVALAVFAALQTQKAEQASIRSAESAAIAVKAEQAARDSAAVAQQQRAAANESALEARRNADALAQTLLQLGKTTEQVVAVLSAQADTLILQLNYPAATEKLKSAGALHKPSPAFRNAVQEAAFFWTEAGKLQQAAALLRETDLGALPERRDALRAFLKKMNPAHYHELENRYFGEMVPIKGGAFRIGANKMTRDSGIAAAVEDFEMARTETTFWQYGLFCQATNRNIREKTELNWTCEGHDPIINVDWYDAIEYANWLSVFRKRTPAYRIDSLHRDSLNKSVFDGKKWIVRPIPGATGYRLPTEAQWEYAARGGEDYVYAGSDNLNAVGWLAQNVSRTRPVQGLRPNGFGLFDMSGNVWEWCWDWYEAYPKPFPERYEGSEGGSSRVIRGGSWGYIPQVCLVVHRGNGEPGNLYNGLGFRLARTGK